MVINKIDRKDARPAEVLNQTEDLFLKLATSHEHLDFPVIYAVGREGRAGEKVDQLASDLTPLFELILREVPNAVVNTDQPLQMLVSTLDYDTHLGKIGVGRVMRGTIKVGQMVAQVTPEAKLGTFRIEKLFTSHGIKREEIEEAPAGDIVGIAGVPNIEIGQTITDTNNPVALPQTKIEEPTLKITVGPNTSPFAGREGKFVTGRQVWERLAREKEINLGLKISEADGGAYTVIGRGELHLAVLLETMRREGYELQVSKPEVILKDHEEPFEEVTIDLPDEYVGIVTTEMGKRRATLVDMAADGRGNTRIMYEISQRNLMGARNILLTQSKGTVLFNSVALGYRPLGETLPRMRNGVLVAFETGKATTYSLNTAQERGTLFVGPGVDVYAGMVVGLNNRESDIDINVTKGMALTNMRQSFKNIKPPLTPPVEMSIEQALDFIEDDELLEITPKNIRLRKKLLMHLDRVRANRKQG